MGPRLQNLVPRALMILLLGTLSGCIVVRTTELRVKFNQDGTGEALMRLFDIRSDAQGDSAIVRDFGIMIASMEKEGIEDFERVGREITRKQFFVEGDTLNAEIVFAFTSQNAIDGLHVTDEAMFVVVNEGREIVKTNGAVESWGRGAQRIVWERNATRLLYVIREVSLPRSTSLASLYRKYQR